jgi:3'-5' exoribonuclease 1
VVLMRWAKKKDGSRRLVVVDEFHSYVRPTFQPTLHAFCTELTGVTQASNLISTVIGINI